MLGHRVLDFIGNTFNDIVLDTVLDMVNDFVDFLHSVVELV